MKIATLIFKLAISTALLFASVPSAQAEPPKTGKAVARAHQKSSVKSGKKLMKSFAKMTKPKKGGRK